MKKLLIFNIFLFLLIQISFSQDSLRSLNEVVYSIYTSWDEEKLNNKISPKFLHKDIDSFVETIEKVGVNPYFNFPKDSFYHDIELLKNRIDTPLTRKEFLLQFVPVANKLNLSHTKVKPDYWVYENIFNKNGGTYFPINIEIENNSLFVIKDYSSYHLAEGTEIISISNMKSNTIIDSLRRYSSGTTQNAEIMDVQNDFSFWLWWVYNVLDTFKVQTPNELYSIKGMNPDKLDSLEKENTVQQKIHREDDIPYEYKQLDSTTGKLNFRHFAIRGETANKHFRRFLDSVFLQLRVDSIQNLIIDVRGNPGGNNSQVEVAKYLYDKPFKTSSKVIYKKSKIAYNFFRLMLYPEDRNDPEKLKIVNDCFGPCQSKHSFGESYECDKEAIHPNPDSIRFDGKLFVLTDHKTNSSAVDFAVLIKDYNMGKIIGSETRQSPSNDANGMYFMLSHSNVIAEGATQYVVRPNGDPSTQKGIIPDYKVTQKKEDTEKGIDTVMEFTMKLIDNKN